MSWMVSGKVLFWWQCAAMLWKWHPLAETSSASAARCQQCTFFHHHVQMQIVRFHHISRILHFFAGLVVPSVEKAWWNYYYLWK
jgi:hypothetical protein